MSSTPKGTGKHDNSVGQAAESDADLNLFVEDLIDQMVCVCAHLANNWKGPSGCVLLFSCSVDALELPTAVSEVLLS